MQLTEKTRLSFVPIRMKKCQNNTSHLKLLTAFPCVNPFAANQSGPFQLQSPTLDRVALAESHSSGHCKGRPAQDFV